MVSATQPSSQLHPTIFESNSDTLHPRQRGRTIARRALERDNARTGLKWAAKPLEQPAAHTWPPPTSRPREVRREPPRLTSETCAGVKPPITASCTTAQLCCLLQDGANKPPRLGTKGGRRLHPRTSPNGSPDPTADRHVRHNRIHLFPLRVPVVAGSTVAARPMPGDDAPRGRANKIQGIDDRHLAELSDRGDGGPIRHLWVLVARLAEPEACSRRDRPNKGGGHEW